MADLPSIQTRLRRSIERCAATILDFKPEAIKLGGGQFPVLFRLVREVEQIADALELLQVQRAESSQSLGGSNA